MTKTGLRQKRKQLREWKVKKTEAKRAAQMSAERRRAEITDAWASTWETARA